MKTFIRKVAVRIRELIGPQRFQVLVRVKFFSTSEEAWYCEFSRWGQICSGLLFLPKESNIKGQVLKARAIKFLRQGYWHLKLV